MLIESLDAVLYTCIFILPGFIIQEVSEVISPRKKQSDSRYLINCLLFSVIHLAVWSWLYVILGKMHQSHIYWYWFLLVLVTVLGAVLLALAIGSIQHYSLISKCLRALKINANLPQPTAWDYIFSKQEAAWVIITLVSGSVVYGKYADKSFSSSESEERDLYIEETYTINEKGKWIADKGSKGVLIKGDQIQTIEFYK